MSRPASPPQHLPRGIRFAALVCMVLSGLTGLGALNQAVGLSHLSERKAALPTAAVQPGEDPSVLARILDAHHAAAVEGMRDSRSLILGALAVACAFAFVSAGRLLQPGGLSQERIRRLLGGATLSAAILRTIDGAQMTVVASRSGPAMAETLVSHLQPPDPSVAAQLQAQLPSLLSTSMVVMTLLVAGSFALLTQYFRSERVRQVILARSGDDDLAED
ncbi:MAG TPA: hypothetical protein VLQ93_08795 [Myxococcaceae bacterium]|nr:hypothetical protein [Myxococcaceae bacterium]